MKRLISALMLVMPIWSAAAAETIRIPKDHFLGISQPFLTRSSARESAHNELEKQILRTIGGEYSVHFESQLTQKGDSFYQNANEEFKYSASGFLTGIEGNIVSESYNDTDDGIVCQIVAHLPAPSIDRMRRLSMGAKVLVSDLGDGIFEFREINGVDVTLTSAEITIHESIRFAKFINYYIMKIHPGDIRTTKVSLPEPIFLKAGKVKQAHLPIPYGSTSLADALVGKTRSSKLKFIGTDELGRDVSVNISIKSM